MLRLMVDEIGDGQHPSELMVSVATADGQREKMVIDRRSLKEGTIEVGYPVGSQDNRFLIELPRETLRGFWRVWVGKDRLIEGAAP